MHQVGAIRQPGDGIHKLPGEYRVYHTWKKKFVHLLPCTLVLARDPRDAARIILTYLRVRTDEYAEKALCAQTRNTYRRDR